MERREIGILRFRQAPLLIGNMSRGQQKLIAFLLGFPLFVGTFGLSIARGFESDMQGLYLYAVSSLIGLSLWLWGVFAPIRND